MLRLEHFKTPVEQHVFLITCYENVNESLRRKGCLSKDSVRFREHHQASLFSSFLGEL